MTPADHADCQIADEILRPVGQLHGNDVARAEAQRLQSTGKRRHPPCKLAKGQALPFTDDRGRVWRLRGRSGEPL